MLFTIIISFLVLFNVLIKAEKVQAAVKHFTSSNTKFQDLVNRYRVSTSTSILLNPSKNERTSVIVAGTARENDQSHMKNSPKVSDSSKKDPNIKPLNETVVNSTHKKESSSEHIPVFLSFRRQVEQYFGSVRNFLRKNEQ